MPRHPTGLATLERDPDNAAVARRHIAASAVGDRIEVIEGDARETLLRLPGPFDLVWIALDFARRVHEHEALHDVLLTVGDGLLLAWPAPH